MKKLFIKISGILIFCLINTNIALAQQLTLPQSNACLNDTILIPVNFNNIDSLAALTLYITYDTAVLVYAGFDHVNTLTPGIMCGVPTAGINAWQVVVSWVDNTLNGVNLVSGILCDLKFKYKGGNSSLNFLTSSELVNQHLINITPAYTNGNIGPTILTHPASTQICEMGQTSLSVTAISGSTYQWQVQNGVQWDHLQNSTLYSDVNTNSLQILQALYTLNNKVYRCVVTKTCSQFSNSATLTVYPKPVIVINNDTTICNGNSVLLNGTGTTGTGILLYNWDMGLGSGIAHTVSPVINTTYHLTVTDANACSAMDSIMVNVNQLPSLAGSIQGTTTVCQGENGLIYTVPVVAYATSYIWTMPTGATGTSTTNSISVNYSTSAISGDITVRGDNTCGIGATSSLTITVNPLPTITNSATANTCSGTGPNINLTASTASTFAWTIGTVTGGITGASAASGSIINQILTNPGNATAGAVQYIVTPTSNTGSCVGNAFTITVTVNPIPVVTNAATVIACSGAGPNITLTSSTLANFAWTIGTITGGITGASAGSGTAINQILTNPGNTTAGTVQYLVTPTSVAGSCVGASFTITITVNPAPAVTNAATAVTCSGTSPNVTLTSSVPAGFAWTIGNITGSITGASAGSGAAINQILTNPGNTIAGTIQYIVTPTSSGSGCMGTAFAITVTVNPAPAVTNVATANTCSGTGPNINLTASTASTFAWTIGTVTGGITGASAASGSIINQILTNPGNATAGTVQYIVTPTSNTGSCVGNAFTFTVTVNPIPVVTNAATAAACSGTSANIALTSSAPANFAWTIGTITGGITGASAGSGTVINQVLTNPTTTAGTVAYIVTPTSVTGNCTGNALTITVTVNPLPSVAATITGLTTVCQGQSNVLYTVPLITNATAYIWTLPSGASGSSAANTINVNYSTSAVSGNISVNGQNSCGNGVLSTLLITVSTLPDSAAAINGLSTLCQGQTGVTYNIPVITNATSYSWTLPVGAIGTSTTNSIVVDFTNSAVSGNIVVKGNNACGSGDSSLLAVTIDQPVGTAGAITGLTSVCQGQTAVIYNVPTITNATSYVWSLPTGATGTSATNSITVDYSSTAVSGNIVVKGSNSCGTGDSSLLTITVNPLPAAAGTIISINNDSVSISENNVLYSVPNIANATSYIWAYSGTGATFIGGNTTTTDSVRINFSAAATSGNLTVMGHNACGDGVVSANYPVWVSPVGIGELSNAMNFRIYPNPTKGKITIETDVMHEKYEIHLYNLQGQMIDSEVIGNSNNPLIKEINLKTFPKGIYFIKIKNDKFVKVEKVILQ